MKRRQVRIAVGAALLALLALGGTALGGDQARTAKSKPIPLAAATLIVEVNGTDGDAGLQFFLDGEPWRSMTISDPTRRVIVDVDAEGRLKDWGLTELFSESNEPPFDEVPLAEFNKRFPEGIYKFVGTTVEGERSVGKARLSHDIPNGPEITSPADGAEVPRTNVVARWTASAQPPGIDIVGYRVIVTREDPLRVYSVDLPASANRVPIPSEFLESGTEYELEIQAIEESGNWTFSTSFFTVK
jgi:hypothetical protein